MHGFKASDRLAKPQKIRAECIFLDLAARWLGPAGLGIYRPTRGQNFKYSCAIRKTRFVVCGDQSRLIKVMDAQSSRVVCLKLERISLYSI